MFSFFKRKPSFGDAEQSQFIDAISGILLLQLLPTGTEVLPPECKPKALGYIYGFIDAALRTIGHDMADTAIGVPVTQQVLRHVFPGAEREYMEYLLASIGRDQNVMLGMSYGGQQYLDYSNKKIAAPMGLGRIIVEGTPIA